MVEKIKDIVFGVGKWFLGFPCGTPAHAVGFVLIALL